MSWYETAIKEIEDDLDAGYITNAEYYRRIRDLNAEVREIARQDAQDIAEERLNGCWY